MYFCPPQLHSPFDDSGVYIICVDSEGYFNSAYSNALVLRWAILAVCCWFYCKESLVDET